MVSGVPGLPPKQQQDKPLHGISKSPPRQPLRPNKYNQPPIQYGGRYGPAFSAFFEEQNQKIANGTLTTLGETFDIHLDTLGIVNGCVDLLSQELSYPTIAYNNTYGIEAINQTLYEAALIAYTRPDTGCLAQILLCQSLASTYDPLFIGSNTTLNEICGNASYTCSTDLEEPYIDYSGRNYYDIAAIDPDPFPPNYFLGYLNRHHIQAALGVPINFTESNNAVYYAFSSTGDYARGGYMQDLGSLLDEGVKVALMYGDRDYACNWIGGENVSLHIPWRGASGFQRAGYADIVTNATYNGGLVRQYGNLSFSRVFEAGHEVPAYQPETAYRIFHRALFGQDIATGNVSPGSNYSTQGPSSSWATKNQVPAAVPGQCYVLNLFATCTEAEVESVINGTAVVRDWIVVGNGTAGGNASVSGNSSASGRATGNVTGSTIGSTPLAVATTGAGGMVLWSWALMMSAVWLCGGWAVLD